MRELGKTHDVMRFAFFDHFPYTKHVECGALLVARPRKVASADQPDTAAHEKPGAKVAKEAQLWPMRHWVPGERLQDWLDGV